MIALDLGCKIRCGFVDKLEHTMKTVSAHHARASLCFFLVVVLFDP
jgi:hypothetical protein